MLHLLRDPVRPKLIAEKTWLSRATVEQAMKRTNQNKYTTVVEKKIYNAHRQIYRERDEKIREYILSRDI